MALMMGADRVLERIEALWDELNELEDRLAARFGGTPETGARIAALEEGVRKVAARQEEILARLNRVAAAQATPVGDDVALTTLDSGHRIYADARDVGIGAHLLTSGMWEPGHVPLFRRLLRPGQRVLDLGANHGVYTLVAAEAVGPSGEVHAFEPNPRLARLATHSVLLNGYAGWARVHEAAAGEAAGTGVLAFDPIWSGAGNLRAGRPEAAGVPVRVVALDEAFPDPEVVVHAVKMDIEGGEGLALRGMRRLLERSPDARIMMDFSPAKLADAGTPAGEVAGMLDGLGFRAWDIGGDGRLSAVEWDDLYAPGAASGRMGNILVARGEEMPR